MNSVYIGNAYASTDAAYDRMLCEEDHRQATKEQMVQDWLDGYVLLGRRGVDAVDEFGTLSQAADRLVDQYLQKLAEEAAQCCEPY